MGEVVDGLVDIPVELLHQDSGPGVGEAYVSESGALSSGSPTDPRQHPKGIE